MSNEIIEESFVDVIGIIPAHMRNFSSLSIDAVTGNEIEISLDGTKLKGRINDSVGTNMCFKLHQDTEDAELVSCADKIVNFEKVFYIPKEELTKPFLPSSSLKPNA